MNLARILAVTTLAGAFLWAAGCTPETEFRRTTEPVKKIKPPPVQPDPVEKAAAARFESLLKAAQDKVAAARDVTARLVRREVVGSALQPVEEIDFKQRFSPHSLRLKWVGEQFKGREIIYVKGANDDKVLAKSEGGGLSGFFTRNRILRLALDSSMVKGQSRYGPDVAGYNNLLKRLASLYREARALRLAWVQQWLVESSARSVQKFEVTREPVLLGGDVSRAIVWFDLAAGLPTHVIVYDAKGRLVEDYDWQNLRLNAGLTDADFSFQRARQ